MLKCNLKCFPLFAHFFCAFHIKNISFFFVCCRRKNRLFEDVHFTFVHHAVPLISHWILFWRWTESVTHIWQSQINTNLCIKFIHIFPTRWLAWIWVIQKQIEKLFIFFFFFRFPFYDLFNLWISVVVVCSIFNMLTHMYPLPPQIIIIILCAAFSITQCTLHTSIIVIVS